MQDEILNELRNGDRTIEQLYNACRCDNYDRLLSTLYKLKRDQLVQCFFDGVLVWQLRPIHAWNPLTSNFWEAA